MNQQHLSAYLNLIQALLVCPDGEEWNILHQHEELINSELLQFMKQVSQQLLNDGKLEAAHFLEYWTEQLNHLLVETDNSLDNDNDAQKYFNLMQALLDCPEGKEEEVLAANKDLVNPRFVYLIKQVAQQMAARGEKETAIYLSNLAASISQALTKQANLSKLKIDPQARMNHIVNSDYLSQFPPLEESISDPNHKYSPNNPISNFVATSSPQKESSPNKQGIKELNELNQVVNNSLESPTQASSDYLGEQQISEISLISRINAKLDAVAASVQQLEQIITSRSQPVNPLWYMDTLERAQASNWLLTSEEIEQLIGTKPKCELGQDTFQRGCWIFTKVGKIGSQSAWKISKENI